MSRIFFVLVSVLCLASAAMAQDPVEVDPKHYKVEFEHARVRVLHIQYGPHEKSVMHRHPDAVAVFLADQSARFTLPDGKTIERGGKAGQAIWTPAETHLPENIGDKALDVILVELKSQPGARRSKK
jgi:quercetin dioxygenase-like cupin family protein